MGAANVIPGVSGGTVAFVTGIYERLINAIKSCDLTALQLLAKGKIREVSQRIDFWFLLCLGSGVSFSIVTFAKLLQYLFKHQPVHVYAFFFGLIVASIYFVGKKVKNWGASPVGGFLIGLAVAVGVALMTPAKENTDFFYLVLCGVVAMASMIIPGISGSFVLLLMGNYSLVMIDSVVKLSSGDLSVLRVLIPVGVGAVIGLVVLSHLLAWIFKRYHDTAVALMTGFVAGSLLIIWPWKHEETQAFVKAGETKLKVIGYEWFFPDFSPVTFAALGVMLTGVALVWILERCGSTVGEF